MTYNRRDLLKSGIPLSAASLAVPPSAASPQSADRATGNSADYKHQIATYGPLDKFGYKDFIPMFTASGLTGVRRNPPF